jgi:hypothetical protein
VDPKWAKYTGLPPSPNRKSTKPQGVVGKAPKGRQDLELHCPHGPVKVGCHPFIRRGRGYGLLDGMVGSFNFEGPITLDRMLWFVDRYVEAGQFPEAMLLHPEDYNELLAGLGSN